MMVYQGEMDIFNQPCGNLGTWPLRGMGVGWLVHVRSKCSPLRGGSSRREPLILVLHFSGLHVDFNYFGNEVTP
jgi:hypothetical protein